MCLLKRSYSYVVPKSSRQAITSDWSHSSVEGTDRGREHIKSGAPIMHG